MEEWKAVPGTNNLLLISSEGRVKSLLTSNERILKAQKDQKGYLRVSFTLKRVKRTYKVHRLVAEAFIDNPMGYQQVNHINGNRSDNNVTNLEWCTNRQNVLHSFAMRSGEVTDISHMEYMPKSIHINGKRVYLDRGTREYIFTNPSAEKKSITGYHGDETKAFESISEAERFLNSRHIVDVLKGRRKHVKGWTFVYAKGGDANDHTYN